MKCARNQLNINIEFKMFAESNGALRKRYFRQIQMAGRLLE